jgi:hypothetical protein
VVAAIEAIGSAINNVIGAGLRAINTALRTGRSLARLGGLIK